GRGERLGTRISYRAPQARAGCRGQSGKADDDSCGNPTSALHRRAIGTCCQRWPREVWREGAGHVAATGPSLDFRLRRSGSKRTASRLARTLPPLFIALPPAPPAPAPRCRRPTPSRTIAFRLPAGTLGIL